MELSSRSKAKRELRAYQVKALYADMGENKDAQIMKLSNRTIQHKGTMLRMALRYAAEVDNLIAVNPVARVKLPLVITKIPASYSREELNRLLKAAESHRLYFRLAAYNGTRLSEPWVLSGSDFDGEAGNLPP